MHQGLALVSNKGKMISISKSTSGLPTTVTWEKLGEKGSGCLGFSVHVLYPTSFYPSF